MSLRVLAQLFTLVNSCYGSIPIYFNKPPDPPKQFHEATYNFGWDINMSPYAGGEDILFLHRCIERTEGWLISKSPVYYSKAPQARIWRLSELLMGWLPLNYLAVVVEHEIFGHGYRIRDINHGKIKVKGYGFNTPPPYGPGGAVTIYDVNEKLTTTDESAVAMAGVESTAILAWIAKLKWLESGKIDPRQVALYLLGQYDLILYIGSLDALDDHEMDGHDIKAYVESVNQTYTANRLKGGRLRSLSWMNLGDPFTYYSIYAWLHYVSSGKESKIPMIPLFGYGYLPGIRLGLTPFGPEYFVENFLLKENRPIYFYAKGGRHAKNNYFGLGMYASKIWTVRKWSFGLRFDGWVQPKLLLQQASKNIFEIDFAKPPNSKSPLYPYSEQYDMRVGAAGSVLVSWKIDRLSGLDTELGYKAQGFLPGYSLKASPVVRAYYTLFF
jgi:hypothetical protein